MRTSEAFAAAQAHGRDGHRRFGPGAFGLVGCPLIPSIVAVILGNQARAKIRHDPTLNGDSMARAGVILGWVGIGLAALAVIGLIIAAALGPTTATFNDPDLLDALAR